MSSLPDASLPAAPLPAALSTIGIAYPLDDSTCNPCRDPQAPEARVLTTTTNPSDDLDTLAALREHQPQFCHNINAVNDLLSKLPVELRCIIFREVVASSPRGDVVLTSVCKSWRDAALATPGVWGALHVPRITPNHGCLERVQRWLTHAKQVPLSIDFEAAYLNGSVIPEDAHWDMACDVVAALMAKKGRIRAVDTTNLSLFREKMVHPMAEKRTIWPALTHLVLPHLTLQQAVELLRYTPKAVSVKLEEILVRAESETEIRTQMIRLPHLKHLTVSLDGWRGTTNVNLGGVIQYLETPALETLKFSSHDDVGPAAVVEAFLRRSACALTTLDLCHRSFDRESLLSLLKSQPSLRSLAMQMHPWSSLNQSEKSSAALNAMMSLLVTDSQGVMGTTKAFTTGAFLPYLESFQHLGGEMILFSWRTIADVCSAHSDVTEEERRGQHPLKYRPLILVQFYITPVRYYSRDDFGEENLRQLVNISRIPKAQLKGGFRFDTGNSDECNIAHLLDSY